MDGPWQLVSVRNLLSVAGSESHAVSAWPWSVHCTITLRWEDTLSRAPGEKTLICSRSSAYTLQVVGQTQPVYEQLVYAQQKKKKITHQQQQSAPIDIQFYWAWLVIKTMRSAKRGAKNEGIRHTCTLHTFGKVTRASTSTNYRILVCYKLWECRPDAERENRLNSCFI